MNRNIHQNEGDVFPHSAPLKDPSHKVIKKEYKIPVKALSILTGILVLIVISSQLFQPPSVSKGNAAPYQTTDSASISAAHNIDRVPTDPNGNIQPLQQDQPINFQPLITPQPNQGNLDQISNQIIQLQQQVTAQMQTCMMNARQMQSQIVALQQQERQLQTQVQSFYDQMNRVDNSTTSGQNQYNNLQNQAQQMQNRDNQLLDTIYQQQSRFYQSVSDCQGSVQQLQSNMQDLQSRQNDQFFQNINNLQIF